MDNTRLQEIQRENKIQEKQNEELRGRIEAVEAASKAVLRVEDAQRRSFRKHLRIRGNTPLIRT